MTTKSWAVTLTPLIVAILQLIRPIQENRPITSDEVNVFVVALLAFLGSGAIGVMAKSFRK